jgi:hypothetical protein
LYLAQCFGTFLPNTLAINSKENYLRKSCPALAPKMFVKLTTAVAIAACMFTNKTVFVN